MSTIKQALREAAEKVTALNLDSAQEVRKHDDEYIECPTCCGDGHIEVDMDYCNIDDAALGVLFYGIGERHGLAEQYFRAANPAAVLALLDELEAAEKKTVEMPTFDGYVPHVARELQAAFRIACDNAGINVATGTDEGDRT